MRKLLFTFLFFPMTLWSQKMYETSIVSEADLKVFITDIRSQSDLQAQIVERPSEMGDNGLLWCFTNVVSEADYKIYFVSEKSQADIVVEFVQYRSDVEWLNKKKKHLLLH